MNVWDRYAHVVFASASGSDSPTYQLVQQDMYRVNLDVCGAAFKSLKVTRVAYASPVPEGDLKCLNELASDRASGVRLFSVKAN